MNEVDMKLIEQLKNVKNSDRKFVLDVLYYARTDEEREKLLNILFERRPMNRNDVIYEAFRIGAKRMGLK